MLQPSTLSFLKKLRKHNDRPWFDAHKSLYLDAKEDFDLLIQKLLHELARKDAAYGLLTPKDCVFRIYRDIRFSKNKTPYKTHFAAGINKGGKKVHFPGYFLHIQPGGNTYLGGGIWRPGKELLRQIRQEIDYNYEDFLGVVQKPSFRKKFGTLSADDKLVRPPRGYEEENPAIDYLKLKSFTASCSLEDKDLTSPYLVRKIKTVFKQMDPLLAFLETAMDG